MYCLADALTMLFTVIVWFMYMFVYMVAFEKSIKLSRMASYSIFITQIGEKKVRHPYKFMFTWNFT
jgi:hypothetical protein